ncbi:MAG TPA: hypothetical protein VKU19_24260 [Bryobacteraceae bacterium]|nr:hypothetical protein [Bryobacteraceae bacterium]
MLILRITAGVVLATMLVYGLETDSKGLVWQSGQIVSMKEEVSDQDSNWTSYVYRLHGRDHTYTLVSSAPLKAYIHSTVKFAVEKNIVYIQDVDGKQRKTCILEQPDSAPHR